MSRSRMHSAPRSAGLLWRQSAGRGRPALLLHGLGASAHYWDRLMKADTGHRLVAPDLLGFGRSPAPPDASYSLECHLEALEPMLEPGTVLVGHSTGSILAAALAAVRPGLVSSLVLVSAPVYANEAEAREQIERIGLLAKLTVRESVWARVLCEAMCHLRPVAVAAAPALMRDMPRRVAADGARHTWPSYSRTLTEVVARSSIIDELAKSDMPVTFLHGRRDTIASVQSVERLVASVSGSRSVDLRVVDCDHHLPIRLSHVVAEEMRRR